MFYADQFKYFLAGKSAIARENQGQRGTIRALAGICQFHLSYF